MRICLDWRKRAARERVALTVLCASVLVGCQPAVDTHDHHSHEGADISRNSWPPVLENASNFQAFPVQRRIAARNSVLDAARKSVLNNRGTRSLLGNNFREINASMGDSKSSYVATFVFYNYSANLTIETFLLADGSILNEPVEAASYQPTEHVDEVNAAIELAAADLLSAGIATNSLTGTAMLAHPESESSGALFFSERILYVTFGTGNGELPAYSAVVNLSNGSVSDAGPIR